MFVMMPYGRYRLRDRWNIFTAKTETINNALEFVKPSRKDKFVYFLIACLYYMPLFKPKF